jgi:hypothetical protein
MFRIGLGPDRFDRRRDHAREGEWVHVEFERAGHEMRGVQQIVDELCLSLGISLDGLEGTRGLLITQLSRRQKAGPALDGVERRAKLVRHGREKGILGLIGALCVGSGGVLAVEQLEPFCDSVLLGRPIPHHVRIPVQLVIRVAECQQRAPYPDAAAIFAKLGSVFPRAFRCPRSGDLSFSGRLVAGTKEPHEWQTEKFRSVIAEYPLHIAVPAHGASVTIEEKHGVVLQLIDQQSEPFCLPHGHHLWPVLVTFADTKLYISQTMLQEIARRLIWSEGYQRMV